VIDGDTIDVEVRRVIRVRLIDCWAPESRRDHRVSQAAQTAEKRAGIASRENLRQLCEGRDVIVQIPAGEDVATAITMGRWLGRVWLEGDGESLNEKQVAGGFAERAKPERVK
jgi:endonuclease YncB( thermonuclease family)